MSGGEFDKRWMAYLDGQMSAAEATLFDESLDDAARARAEAEMRFEAALADSLAEVPGCPDALWLETLRQVRAAESRPRAISYPRQLAFWTLAASAVVSVSLGVAFFAGSAPSVQTAQLAGGEVPVQVVRLGILEKSVSDFALRTQTSSSREAIEKYLEDHDIRLALVAQADDPVRVVHRIRLLGSCLGNCPKGEIVEVLFDCDGQPAKLVLARADSSGAQLIRAESERGTVVRTKVVGDYVAGVVYSGAKPDEASKLLDMLQVKNARVALFMQKKSLHL